MNRLLGYTDKLTVRPGEPISFRFSCESDDAINVQLVRLINGDAHSDGAAFREQEIPSDLNGPYQGKFQAINSGSCIFVHGHSFENDLSEISIALRCQPSAPQAGKQVLISRSDVSSGRGWSLQVNERGRFEFEVSNDSESSSVIESTLTASQGQWYQLLFSLCAETGDASLWCIELHSGKVFNRKRIDTVTSKTFDKKLPALSSPLAIGGLTTGEDPAGNPTARHTFNGRIENPSIAAKALKESDAQGFAENTPPLLHETDWLARWDFSLEQQSRKIVDRSIYQRHGSVHNLPKRGSKGSNWSGHQTRWTQAPEEYSAIHFHEDDLYDCGWQDDMTWEIPGELKSGIYALRLNQSDSEEYVPFFVAAPQGRPGAKLAFMVPTYTYLAYGNNNIFNIIREGYGVSREQSHEFMKTPGSAAYDDLVTENRHLGLSTYDSHSDGSGVHFSSWLRPLLNMRPKSILWTFCADLLFVDWLEKKGIDYDIITDDLTDAEGSDLLDQYAVIMTGNHPEYPTTGIMDAIKTYLETGGRFMYTGGNGFYWRSAVSSHFPGAIEVRRGRTGTRPWTSEIGEGYHQFTGEKGGQWRELGRPPQQLFGVGFIAQGYGPSYYRVMTDTRQGRAAFILEGINEEIIGDYGVFGGAAGEEIDCANQMHGTPDHAIVIARSENHGPGMLYVLDEMTATQPLEIYAPMTHADVVFFETEGGGAVFSTGAMGWCGSLAHRECDNAISRITENVIRRFSDPAPFCPPSVEE
ncbi:MAG: N,N-dimethylformamidase beta subunit family domain-containing protein [Pseudomonadota bacterium]